MKIRLSDIEGLLPGDHSYLDGVLTLKSKHIDIFRDHPNATFEVIRVEPNSGPKKYILGTFEADD